MSESLLPPPRGSKLFPWLRYALIAPFLCLVWAAERPSEQESAADAMALIQSLREQVAYHDDLYYRQAEPEITDFEYDRLKQRLEALERAFPAIAERLGGRPPLGDDRSGDFPAFRHGAALLSLEKVHSLEELTRFCEDVGDPAYWVEPKVDGMAISVVYENGRMVHLATRGDGFEGEDISVNAERIRNLPLQLKSDGIPGESVPIPARVELRGEVFMTWAEFERINALRMVKGEAVFAHPRNLAVGTAKASALEEPRSLEIVFYDVGELVGEGIEIASHAAFYRLAEAWGLPLFKRMSYTRSPLELKTAVEELERSRGRMPYPVDGIVVKADGYAIREKRGSSREAPRWAVAYKFAPDWSETTLRAISFQVGRTGVLTPVAELEPVSVSGSVIERASLSNRAAIERMDLRIGDSVIVERAGSVIPRVTGVNLEKRASSSLPFAFPKTCPACEVELVEEDALELRCGNRTCPALLRARIEHFVSRKGMAIRGLGASRIEALARQGFVSDLADLYSLPIEGQLVLPNGKAVSMAALREAVEASKSRAPLHVFYGLGLPEVGWAKAQALAQAYPSLEALSRISLEDAKEGGPAQAAGLSERDVELLVAYFADADNRRLVERLIELKVGLAASRGGP